MRSKTKLLKQYLSAEAVISNRESRPALYLNALLTGITHMPSVIGIIRGKYVFFPQVEIALTTKCTLRCKDCSNLMQYYDKPADIGLDKNIESINNFLTNTDLVDRFILLGGEPFLYKELAAVLRVVLGYKNKVKRVWIYTNGTIVPKDEELLYLLANKKVRVHISNYGEISRKKKELVELFKSNNIKYNLADEDANWFSMGTLEKRNRSKESLAEQFNKCDSYCNNILNGRLCYCARSSGCVDLGVVHNEKSVELTGGIRDALMHFVYDYVDYLETCDFCDKGTDRAYAIKKAIQTQNPLKY